PFPQGSDNLCIGRREAYALGRAGRALQGLVPSGAGREDRFAVRQEPHTGGFGAPSRAQAALGDRLAEGARQGEAVQVDSDRGPAELRLTRADAGVDVEHLRAVWVEPDAGHARALPDPERLDGIAGK